MLDQRRRRWINIKPAFLQYIMLAGPKHFFLPLYCTVYCLIMRIHSISELFSNFIIFLFNVFFAAYENNRIIRNCCGQFFNPANMMLNQRWSIVFEADQALIQHFLI